MTAHTFVLDAGALIALERSERRMTVLLARLRSGRARVAALLGLKPEQCLAVPLDTAAAKRIGRTIAECGHSDVVDVHVALVAREPHAFLMTSDRGDLLAVDPSLEGSIVDI